MKIGEMKWELLAERVLLLAGTKIIIIYFPGYNPYHVHRDASCHGAFQYLEDAKEHVLVVVAELMEMGVDP